MKRVVFLISFLIFSSGCNSYRVARFESSPSVDVVVYDDNRELIPESELIGRQCKIELRDGSIVEGKIYQIDQQSITISEGQNDSALNWENKDPVVVMKDQVSAINLACHSPGKTNLLTLGAGVALAGVLLLAAMAHGFRNNN